MYGIKPAFPIKNRQHPLLPLPFFGVTTSPAAAVETIIVDCHHHYPSDQLTLSNVSSSSVGSDSRESSFFSAHSCGGADPPCSNFPGTKNGESEQGTSSGEENNSNRKRSKEEEGCRARRRRSKLKQKQKQKEHPPCSPFSSPSSSSSSPCCSCSAEAQNSPCIFCYQQEEGRKTVGSESTEETLTRDNSCGHRNRHSRCSSVLTLTQQQQQQVAPQQEQQPLYIETTIIRSSELDKINAISATKACACEECALVRQRDHHEHQIQGGDGRGSMAGPSAGGGGGRTGLMGSFGGGTNSLAAVSGPTTSNSSGGGLSQQQQQMMLFCNGPTNGQTQTIEEQIKQIDRISKECDNSRKSLESINRRLDDLNDEVRRYREFLGHEKTRRDPALYKTSTAEPLSVYNDSICRLIDSLTSQLTLEWTEKLRSIQHQTIAKFSSDKG